MIIELPPIQNPEMDAEPKNVIPIDVDADRELEITKLDQGKKRACTGRHRSVIVDSVSRTIACRHCGFTIDPFDYLKQWAEEGARRMEGLRGIEARRRIVYGECEALEKRLESVRGKLKREGFEQPQEERMDYKHRLLNAQWSNFA